MKCIFCNKKGNENLETYAMGGIYCHPSCLKAVGEENLRIILMTDKEFDEYYDSKHDKK